MEHDFSAIYAYRTQPSMKDYPGRMAGLFFTPGCNFRCGFCHNPDLLEEGKKFSWEELDGICRKFSKQWISAAAITGGEPTIHAELPETVRFFRKRGFTVKLDTNGSNPDMLEELLPMLDYVAMDIKCALHNYGELSGYQEQEKLRRSIQLIMDKAKDYEFRTTVIETYHNDEELRDCAKVIQGAKRYILQPFVPHDNLPWPALRTQPRTRSCFLEHALEVVQSFVQNAEVRDHD